MHAPDRRLMSRPSDVDAELGDSVVLECAASHYQSSGTSDITWTRDGQCLPLLKNS